MFRLKIFGEGETCSSVSLPEGSYVPGKLLPAADASPMVLSAFGYRLYYDLLWAFFLWVHFSEIVYIYIHIHVYAWVIFKKVVENKYYLKTGLFPFLCQNNLTIYTIYMYIYVHTQHIYMCIFIHTHTYMSGERERREGSWTPLPVMAGGRVKAKNQELNPSFPAVAGAQLTELLLLLPRVYLKQETRVWN